MIRTFSAVLLAAATCWTIAQAQEIVPVNHVPHSQSAPTVVEGGSCLSGNCATGHCSTGNCGTCNDCIRISDIKKTQVPVYSCKTKEICVPNCSLFALFGCKGECRKIEVHQLVKKYRTDEECITKCVTAEEAAKHYEEEAKKAAEKAKSSMPVPAPPNKLPTGSVGIDRPNQEPATTGTPATFIIEETPMPFRR